MPAIELLERLGACSVSITVDRDELVLRPASKVPAELLAQVKQQKEEILSTLQHPVGLPDAAIGLLTRLQAGSKWLIHQHEQFLVDVPTAASDDQFSAALDLWWALEQTVWQVYGYEGCVFSHGESCSKDAVVPCESCLAR